MGLGDGKVGERQPENTENLVSICMVKYVIVQKY